MSNMLTVDPRGPRFGAWLTSIVLAAVLLTSSGSPLVALSLLSAQAVVFGIGAFFGLGYAPYGLLYRYLLAPRLKSSSAREEVAPPRFAQGVGFGFAAVGVIGFVSGLTTLGLVATALALIAALLNAAFGFCLGCEVYLLLRRAGIPAFGVASH